MLSALVGQDACEVSEHPSHVHTSKVCIMTKILSKGIHQIAQMDFQKHENLSFSDVGTSPSDSPCLSNNIVLCKSSTKIVLQLFYDTMKGVQSRYL